MLISAEIQAATDFKIVYNTRSRNNLNKLILFGPVV